MFVFPISSKLGSLICTMGLLLGHVWLSSGRLPAIADSLPPSEHSTLTTHQQMGLGGVLIANAGLLMTSAQQLDRRSNQPSPWGERYTGTGTSTDSRGSCPGVSVPLVALTPDVNHGRSVSDYPTLWFYVPYDSETIEYGTFLLQDENHKDVITPLDFTLHNTPGVVSVTVPTSEQPLKENQPYHWYFELYCQDNHISPVYVDGWIEKTSLDQALSSSPSSESRSDFRFYSLYRQNFIWFDAVDSIIQEWGEMPNDELAEELLSLLQSANVNLEEWPTDATLTPVLYD